jgi:hypothetical protein
MITSAEMRIKTGGVWSEGRQVVMFFQWNGEKEAHNGLGQNASCIESVLALTLNVHDSFVFSVGQSPVAQIRILIMTWDEDEMMMVMLLMLLVRG